MKTRKWAFMFLLFMGIILFAAQSALAGCEVTSLDALIESSGNAPGTKYSGPITVFYRLLEEVITVPEEPGDYYAEIYFFLRLRKGTEFYQFAKGPITEIEPMVPFIFPTDIDKVAGIIQTFFEDEVIPSIYPGCDLDCPDIVLKSYDMDVDWEAPGINGGLRFFIADIVLAIQD